MHFAERDMTLTDRKRREEAAHCRTALATPVFTPFFFCRSNEIRDTVEADENGKHVARSTMKTHIHDMEIYKN